MTQANSQSLANHKRRCPLCLGKLVDDGASNRCVTCGSIFERTPHGQWDFRVRPGTPITYRDAYVPRSCGAVEHVPVRLESPCPERRNLFTGKAPCHITPDQITYIPQALPGAIALDHGCGTGPHRSLLEDLGYAYHGIDAEGLAAHDLVDAHALPYDANVFDLVLSISVLYQLEIPALAVREIYRVLKPGGYVIGTVPFLEPFNSNGCFNFSHLGLWRVLDRSGFLVEAILCVRRWNAIRAQLHMGFDWRLPWWLADALSRPFVWALDAYALAGRYFAKNRNCYEKHVIHARHAGAFFFVAKKLLNDPCSQPAGREWTP